MLQFRIHTTSPQQVRWPKRDADILALGRRVFAAEQDLPANQQYPQLTLLQTRLEALDAVVTTAFTAEATRTAQSGAEKTAFETAKILSRRLIIVLTARYIDLHLLEAWGVEVVGTGSSVRTRLPRTREAILLMLSRYIAKENSLPAEQRIAIPTLAEVTAAYTDLNTANTLRIHAISTRELANAQRGGAASSLLQILQLIAHHHVAVDFGGIVDHHLQTLGYDLVTHTPSRPPEPENGGPSES